MHELKAGIVAAALIVAGCAQSSTPESVAAVVAADGKAADEASAARERRVEAQARGTARAQADLRWADARDKAEKPATAR